MVKEQYEDWPEADKQRYQNLKECFERRERMSMENWKWFIDHRQCLRFFTDLKKTAKARGYMKRAGFGHDNVVGGFVGIRSQGNSVRGLT